MAKMSEKKRLEYNRDCKFLDQLKATYDEATRIFDAKWNDKPLPVLGKTPWELRGQTFGEWCVEGMEALRANKHKYTAEMMRQKNPLLERLRKP